MTGKSQSMSAQNVHRGLAFRSRTCSQDYQPAENSSRAHQVNSEEPPSSYENIQSAIPLCHSSLNMTERKSSALTVQATEREFSLKFGLMVLKFKPSTSKANISTSNAGFNQKLEYLDVAMSCLSSMAGLSMTPL